MPTATIMFFCKALGCGSAIEDYVDVSYPDFSAERMSDGDAFGIHDIPCPECETVYEVETVNGMGGIRASLDAADIRIELEPDNDDYEDYLANYEPANDIGAEFTNSLDELLNLLKTPLATPSSALNRMIYSQLIATMEAYLSDKILTLATDHTELKKRIITNGDFLKEQSLKVAEVLLEPDKAEKTFKVGLQSILYHDLKKVEKLYNITLLADFWPADPLVKTELERAVKIRHDCVHRNGADTNGKLHSFDEQTIRTLAQHVAALVDHIEEKATDAICKCKGAPLANGIVQDQSGQQLSVNTRTRWQINQGIQRNITASHPPSPSIYVQTLQRG